MQRVKVEPRPDYAAKLEAQGLSFHARDAYWREDVCYRLTSAEVDTLEAATQELHGMCMEAARHLVRNRRLAELQIPAEFRDAIAASLERGGFSLYGRFDLLYDGSAPPKLLEYNADTPTALLESAVCQWFWLEDCFPEADQFNSIHERLIARWKQLPGLGPVHLACLEDQEEDWACTAYLRDTLTQAGRRCEQLSIEAIGWDPAGRNFVDLTGRPIQTLFKLYPWEWMMREQFAPHLLQAGMTIIEPLWKSLLSCKGLLPVLWELYPGHPNLLPAYFKPDGLKAYARKPLYSREGANVTLVQADGSSTTTEGPYGAEGYVYQALAPVPEFDGVHPVIGSWLVNGEAAGIGIREDRAYVTSNTSQFVPHYFD